MADGREEVLARIDELENLLEEMGEESEFYPEQMVNFTHEDHEGVAMVESVNDGQVTIRVMAVAGDNYEPTDDVYTVSAESLTPMATDDNSEHDDDSDEPEEEVEATEEDLEKGMFVSWRSEAGKTVGRVALVSDDEDVVIPETGEKYDISEGPLALVEVFQEKDGWEDTGVHVAISVKDLNVIDPLNLKQRRLMVKAKNFEIKTDDDKKYGYLKGIGSAYGKVDLGGDTVSRGAYTQTINHNDGKVQLMFDHGWEVSKVAGVANLEDSEEGLVVEAKMPLHIPAVKDGYEIAKFMLEEGKPLGFSIGYQVIKSEPLANGVRDLQEIALEEMTITPWPMDTHARIRDAKNRKITYYAKRKAWQTIKAKPKQGDAPTGNRNDDGDYKSLIGELRQLKQNIEE